MPYAYYAILHQKEIDFIQCYDQQCIIILNSRYRCYQYPSRRLALYANQTWVFNIARNAVVVFLRKQRGTMSKDVHRDRDSIL
jgi:hypothetical protein